MPKPPQNSGKAWTPSQISDLRNLARANTPTRVIGLKLGRSPDAISNKASDERISLKPTNQSPYDPRNRK